MTEPVDVARQWLADRVHVVDCGCQSGVHTEDAWDYYGRVADAILQAPGVEVTVEHIVGRSDVSFLVGQVTDTQVVIRLPAQPIEETP